MLFFLDLRRGLGSDAFDRALIEMSLEEDVHEAPPVIRHEQFVVSGDYVDIVVCLDGMPFVYIVHR